MLRKIISIFPFIFQVAHFQNSSILLSVPVQDVQEQNITKNGSLNWVTLPKYLFSLPENSGFSLKKIKEELCHKEPNCLRQLIGPWYGYPQPMTCFKYLGCFANGPPWRTPCRPAKPPDPPRKVSTTAILYTRKISNLTMQIYPDVSPAWFKSINFNLRTTVICHGFMDSGYATWVENMARAILKRRDENVIVLDWGKGAGKAYIEALRALGNMRVAAAVGYRFLRTLGIPPLKMHFIGHSLGAHILTYVSRNFHRKVRWLTGLDPAGLFFEGHSPVLRMRKTDALFTEAIHSNVGVVGDVLKDGHCDFYLNVGFVQPNCLDADRAYKVIFCAHEASYLFYISAIEHPRCYMGTPETLTAIFAGSVNTFAQGVVSAVYNNTICADKLDRCVPMGLESIGYKKNCQHVRKGDAVMSFGYHGSYVVFTGTSLNEDIKCPSQ